MRLHVRTLTDIKDDLDDTLEAAATNWTPQRFRRALNRAIREISNKVLIPTTYTLATAWDADTFAYVLPAWIDTNALEAEWQSATDPQNWHALHSFTIERGTDGLNYIRFQSAPFDATARLRYWHANGVAPITDPLLNAQIAADATSLVTKTKVTGIEPEGFIRIEDEYIQYAGVTQGASTTTLSGLIRGVAATTAAIHAADAQINWAIAVDEPIVFTAIEYFTLTALHEMYLNESAARKKRHHQEMIAYYKNAADVIMKQYVPAVSPRFAIDRMGETVE